MSLFVYLKSSKNILRIGLFLPCLNSTIILFCLLNFVQEGNYFVIIVFFLKFAKNYSLIIQYFKMYAQKAY